MLSSCLPLPEPLSQQYIYELLSERNKTTDKLATGLVNLKSMLRSIQVKSLSLSLNLKYTMYAFLLSIKSATYKMNMIKGVGKLYLTSRKYHNIFFILTYAWLVSTMKSPKKVNCWQKHQKLLIKPALYRGCESRNYR